MKRYTLVGHIKLNGIDSYESISFNGNVKHNLEEIDNVTTRLTFKKLNENCNNRYDKFDIFYNYDGIKRLDVIYDNVKLHNISHNIILRKNNNEKDIKLDRNIPEFSNLVEEFYKHIKDEGFTDNSNKYISYKTKLDVSDYIRNLFKDKSVHINILDINENKSSIENRLSKYKEIRGFVAYLQNKENSKIILEQMKKEQELNKFKNNNSWYKRTTDNNIDPDEEAFLSEEELNQMYGEDSGKHM